MKSQRRYWLLTCINCWKIFSVDIVYEIDIISVSIAQNIVNHDDSSVFISALLVYTSKTSGFMMCLLDIEAYIVTNLYKVMHVYDFYLRMY